MLAIRAVTMTNGTEREASEMDLRTRDTVREGGGAVRQTVPVLIRFRGDAAKLGELGAVVRSVVGDLATADVPVALLGRLIADPDVLYVEQSRRAARMLDGSVRALGVPALRQAGYPATGAGVVIGIIDVDGFDIHHPDFYRDTPEGPRTRIRALWDQRAEGAGVPSPWGYGVEYTAAQIDAEARSEVAHSIVPHRPDVAPGVTNHGTHMAGIAAGNGRASDGKYAGVAPDAELILVNTVDSEERGFADMSKVCDAIAYIFDRAGDRPCVIDISLGDNLGPHDGTSLVERFIDAAVEKPGRAVVVAAGNSNERGVHCVAATPEGSAPVALDLVMPHNADCSETLQVWYDGADRLDVTLLGPDGTRTALVVAPADAGTRTATFTLGGARVTVTSVVHDARNGDNVVEIEIDPEAGATLPAGAYRIELRRSEGLSAPVDGRPVHAWIDGNTGARWKNPARGYCTLTTPGTARCAITVGNYLCDDGGYASSTSGRGPTRDGRRKPDLVAPGQAIMAPLGVANPASREQFYCQGFGTSQAAAHVAGLCAVLFELHGPLRAAALKGLLRRSADRQGQPSAWDPGYGFGRARVVDPRLSVVDEAPETVRVDVSFTEAPASAGR
jgi:subtilisin family serine protease